MAVGATIFRVKLGGLAISLLPLLLTTAADAVVGEKLKPRNTPWVRLDQTPHHMRLSPKGRFIAYIGDDGLGLSVLDLKTKRIFQATEKQVGASFFWSPDGFRLFYRELIKNLKGDIRSVVKAYDCSLHTNVALDSLPHPTGVLTFDPRDLRMHLVSKVGIRTKRIFFPDERLARWQVVQRTEAGKFIGSQKAILWLTHGGRSMRKLKDDDSGVDSFSISPDGSTVAWATRNGRVYSSKNGRQPKFIGHGRDPSWHPDRPEILYAAARMVGTKAASYDLRVTDLRGSGRYLTTTQFSSERWPAWHPDGAQIVYTKEKTTDIFLLEFTE